ncbi:hypothetical protein Dimus_030553, partial [Dionaea muscipula]
GGRDGRRGLVVLGLGETMDGDGRARSRVLTTDEGCPSALIASLQMKKPVATDDGDGGVLLCGDGGGDG